MRRQRIFGERMVSSNVKKDIASRNTGGFTRQACQRTLDVMRNFEKGVKKSELRFETLLRATRFRHFAIFSIFCRFIGIKLSKYTEDASALQTPVIPIKTRFLLRIPHISTNVRFLVNLSFWLVFFVSCFNGFCAYI